MLYKKIPIAIEAVQWHKMGDHPDVTMGNSSEDECYICHEPYCKHGYLKGDKVCPGDWIVEGKVFSPRRFSETYQPIVTKYEIPDALADKFDHMSSLYTLFQALIGKVGGYQVSYS